MTTTPIADLNKALISTRLFFPQFADGGGYTTRLFLLNTSKAVETGKLYIFDDSGKPLVVNRAGGGMGSTFDYSIPPDGVYVFQGDSSPAATNVGWLQVVPTVNTSSPIGAGVFSLLQSGVLVTESGVPSATLTKHAEIYVDQSGNHRTGLAIANPDSSDVMVAVRAYETDGMTPVGTSAGAVSLKSNAHAARFVSELIAGLPVSFTGILEISSPTPIVALTLRSLTNSRGNFLLTTFPTADAGISAPSPIVFPQIADGGGYITELVLLCPAGQSNTTISFIGDDGAPLFIGK